MKVIWKYGKIYSMKLREDLYTLVQLLQRPKLLVYDIQSKHGVWDKRCLNGIKPLFRVYVGSVIHKLMDKRVEVNYSEAIIEMFENFQWIKSYSLQKCMG